MKNSWKQLIALVPPFVVAADSIAIEKKIQVTATVTTVADLVKQVGGERVEVQGLMGSGESSRRTM